MAKNPLFELYEAGTSVWLDYIRRTLMTSGELKRMIDEDAVVGMTSNPTIFEKAISGSSDYDDALRRLVSSGNSDEEIMLSLICLLYTSPSPRDLSTSRMPSSA